MAWVFPEPIVPDSADKERGETQAFEVPGEIERRSAYDGWAIFEVIEEHLAEDHRAGFVFFQVIHSASDLRNQETG